MKRVLNRYCRISFQKNIELASQNKTTCRNLTCDYNVANHHYRPQVSILTGNLKPFIFVELPWLFQIVCNVTLRQVDFNQADTDRRFYPIVLPKIS